ncbi:MAG: hypothetical protein HOE48_11180 [Candidatus Latescibacteria bacterium]|jgi:hypothetical protein|nr:hypothetical protein [Candidatus Latescibacterota bacterium]MBT4138471.1 hypothetical protein [Candidatus Latescibacterota bacterium]
MADHPIMSKIPLKPPTFMTDVRDDLKRKKELLSAACRCLADERSYRFFCHLSSAANLPEEERTGLLDQLETMAEYTEHELGAIKRLVLGDGAKAFKDLVDLVRDIRVEQEIESMLK